jgi:uncharacterized protein YjbI with pentapeptide repeats
MEHDMQAWICDTATGVDDLRWAELARANLTKANLTEADLAYADLRKASLAEANLSAVNLVGAHLTGADLAKANLATQRRIGAEQKLLTRLSTSVERSRYLRATKGTV